MCYGADVEAKRRGDLVRVLAEDALDKRRLARVIQPAELAIGGPVSEQWWDRRMPQALAGVLGSQHENPDLALLEARLADDGEKAHFGAAGVGRATGDGRRGGRGAERGRSRQALDLVVAGRH